MDTTNSRPTILQERKASKKAQRLMKYRKAAKAAAKKPAIKKGKGKSKLPLQKVDKSWLSKPAIPASKAGKRGIPAGMTRGTWKPPKAPTIDVGALRRGGVSAVMGTFRGVEMTPVVSSNVAAVGYKESANELYISFLNGSVYVYRGVDASVHTQLLAAPSKGKFVWREIRDVYPYDQLV